MRYISEDGKVFNTEGECLDHEHELKEAEVQKAKLAKEKDDRLKAIYEKQSKIEEAEKELTQMQKSYLEDYCDVKVGELGDFFDMFGIGSYAFPFTLFRK